ncbi:hypothetical protein OH687_34095 [Burkholderia anthina]|nr:hypothetical protein OH687_34095 [Burkholderia anthina]
MRTRRIGSIAAGGGRDRNTNAARGMPFGTPRLHLKLSGRLIA